MDDGVQQQTQSVDENMPLLSLDQFACQIASKRDPFSRPIPTS
jgi:hypothetical protein